MQSLLKFSGLITLILLLANCQKSDSESNEIKERKAPENALFQTVPSTISGIDFSNDLKEDIRQNIVTNSYLYNGGGVAIADFNNDGLEDLFFTATQNSCKLYLNEGNLKFKDITESAGVASVEGDKTGVTIVDINQDGFQDIYITRTGIAEGDTRRNLLYINVGNLTFKESARAYNLGDPSASNHANFFDYDLDGDLDVYMLNYPTTFTTVNKMSLKEDNGKKVMSLQPRSSLETDRLYRNEGNGTFTDVTMSAGIVNRAWGLSVTVSDFNSDGYPDIFVGNDYIMPDFLYLNQKNGTFKIATEEFFGHTSNHTMGVDIADVNNDQKIDLIALDMLSKDNFRQKALVTTMLVDRYDLLVKHGYMHQLMRNVLQVNNGNNTFSEVGVFSGVSNTDWSWSSLFADYDLDGHKDLFITNGYRRDVAELDYVNFGVDSLNSGTGPMTQEKYDKILNLIPSQKLQNYIFKNNGNLQFDDKSTDWGLVQKTWSNGAAFGDLDNDGDLELVINNVDQPAILYKNMAIEQGKGSWLKVKLIGEKPNLSGIGAKARLTFSDGTAQYLEMTPTRGFLSSVQQVFHFGFKDKTPTKLEVEFPKKKLFTLTQITPNKIINADVKRAVNGTLSAPSLDKQLFASSNLKGVEFKHVENNFVDFNREGLIPHKLSTLGPKVAVADINGDKLEDFYIGGAAGSAASLYLQSAGGAFNKVSQTVWDADAAAEDMEPLFFDADGDGDMDLYVVSGGNIHNDGFTLYQDRFYMNGGNGNFTKGKLPLIGASGSCATAHDYDSDGDLDLFVGGRVKSGKYPMAPNSFILQNNGGQFSDVTSEVGADFQNIGMVTDLVWANIDGQEGDELVVTGEWMPISVYKMEGGKLVDKTAAFGLGDSDGWWNCVTVKDIDGDGDQDLIAGNLGNNSRFKPTQKFPLKMYAKDYDNNSQIDPVMAWAENGKYYPVPNRDKIIKQLPHLRKKYPRYRPYNGATIDQVFSQKELGESLQLEAKTFASSIFINNGDGSFSQNELPSDAQIFPVRELIVEDVNKDGQQDILLIGNDYGMQVESGRIDAGTGLVLLGEGSGNFKSIKSVESGFWAEGDTRDLAPITVNGKRHYLIGVNAAALKILKLQ